MVSKTSPVAGEGDFFWWGEEPRSQVRLDPGIRA